MLLIKRVIGATIQSKIRYMYPVMCRFMKLYHSLKMSVHFRGRNEEVNALNTEVVEIQIRDQNTDYQDEPDPEVEPEMESNDDDTIHGLDRTNNLTNNEGVTPGVVQENESQAQEHAAQDQDKESPPQEHAAQD